MFVSLKMSLIGVVSRNQGEVDSSTYKLLFDLHSPDVACRRGPGLGEH